MYSQFHFQHLSYSSYHLQIVSGYQVPRNCNTPKRRIVSMKREPLSIPLICGRPAATWACWHDNLRSFCIFSGTSVSSVSTRKEISIQMLSHVATEGPFHQSVLPREHSLDRCATDLAALPTSSTSTVEAPPACACSQQRRCSDICVYPMERLWLQIPIEMAGAAVSQSE